MIDKSLNRKKAQIIKEIAMKYGLTDISEDIENFNIRNEEYKVHILMIGGYSTGKSALLNKYIGKNVLKENRAPETDIAAELFFSENEHIVANLLDGTKITIDSSDNINIDETRNIEYYLNSENIKTQCDYIMVDTPGFDSGIEKHNKALMQYIDQGTVYFLVVDCEKGTISESTLNFLNEITQYSSDIAVIINKCDKKIEEDVQKVKEHIEELLLASTGRNFPIVCTSILEKDIGKKIKQLIEQFDPQYLYDKNITQELNERCNSTVRALELIRDSKTCNVEEIEEEILKRNKEKNRLIEQIEKEKKKIKIKLHNEVKEKIISEINSKLMCNVEVLVSAYKGGVELFQERVVGLVRPIFISDLENYSAEVYEYCIKNLSLDSVNVSNSMSEISEVVESIYKKLVSLYENGELIIPVKNGNEEMGVMDDGVKTYRAISSFLAIATDIVAPELELLIVFLPEILKILNVIGGNITERKLNEEIKNTVIPQIVSKYRNSLDNLLDEVESKMVETVIAEVDELLESENSALNIALRKKKSVEDEYEKLIESIDEDIELIRK